MNTERNVRKLKKLLKEAGWQASPQGKGSHAKYRKDGKTIIVPEGYSGELPTGTARQIAKDAGLE